MSAPHPSLLPSAARPAARLALLLVCALFAPVSALRAVSVAGLYEAAVPVADRGEAARNEGFSAALGAVAIKVSGSRDAGARLSAALGNARRYVQRFTYNGGLLQVGFDAAAVDKALVDAGLPVWGRERPATLVHLVMDTPSASGTERTLLENAARQRGIPLVWPALTAADQALLEQSEPADTSLQPLLARYGANAVLVGRGSRSPAEGGTLQWTLQFEGESRTAQGGVDDGIDLAASAFAGTFAARAGSASEVQVAVGNIQTLKSYAETLNYLEALTLVRSLAVERIEGDTVYFRLSVRGDAQTLGRAIGLGRKLIAAQDEPGAGIATTPSSVSTGMERQPVNSGSAMPAVPATVAATLRLRYP